MAALSTPSVLATGTTDVPSLLMTRVPGRTLPPPNDLDVWARGLAGLLPVLHATPLPPGHGLPDFRPYPPQDPAPPPWLKRPRTWERAVKRYRDRIDEPAGLIHRDFHLRNVLWRRGRPSGVVDWQVACVGPPSIDVGWCRLQLLLDYGIEPATRFTAAWEAVSGHRYHPGAELALLVDLLGSAHADPPPRAAVFEDLLAKALAETG